MTRKKEIKYKYAYDSKNNIISISDLTKESLQEEYHCIGCGKELIARLGEMRTHCFAHLNNVECSPETQLHKLAKKIFTKTYAECINENIPYNLEYKTEINCSYCKKYGLEGCKFPGSKTFNLITKYKNIYEETKDGNFKPDILLKDENSKDENYNTIHIQFAVTHKTENPDKRTIEFILKSEDDLELITRRYIPLNDFNSIFSYNFHNSDQINRYNFKTSIQYDNSNRNGCISSFYTVRIYRNEKFEFSEETIQQYEKKLNDPDVAYSKILNHTHLIPNSHKLYIKELFSAYYKNIKVRNCHLCIYWKYNWYRTDNGLFCKKLWKDIIPDDALNCKSLTIRSHYKK